MARTWRHGGNALEGGGGGDAEPCDAASIIDSRDFGGHPCSTTRDSHPARRNVLDRGRDGGHLERRTVYRDLAKPRARNREPGAIGRGASSRRRADIVAHHHRCFSTPTHLASIDAYHHQSMPPAHTCARHARTSTPRLRPRQRDRGSRTSLLKNASGAEHTLQQAYTHTPQT